MRIVAASPSFSRHPVLKPEVLQLSNSVRLNTEGRRFSGQELYDFVGDAQVLIVGLEKVDAQLLEHCPGLKMVAKYGVGLDNIDIELCKTRDIQIGWTPGVNKTAVAELTLSFMLALMRNVFFAAYNLKRYHWKKQGGFQLSGKTIGIVGANYIGKEVIKLLQPFACEILICDLENLSDYCQENNLEQVEFDDLIQRSDIVSLHVPGTAKTENMMNKAVFHKMKETAFVINTARGSVINENDLKEALLSNQIAGAALDVYQQEPLTDRELIDLPNLICTPHMAGNAYESELAMGRTAIAHIKKYITKECCTND